MLIIDPVNGKEILLRSSDVSSSFITNEVDCKKVSISIKGEILHLRYDAKNPDQREQFNKIRDWLHSILSKE